MGALLGSRGQAEARATLSTHVEVEAEAQTWAREWAASAEARPLR